MKTILLFIVFVFFSCNSIEKTEMELTSSLYTSHIGTWTGNTENGNTIKLILKKNGSALFLLNNKKVSIDTTTDKNYKTIYAIGYDKIPYKLDIIFITKRKEGANRVIRCIFEYKTNNVMKLCTYFSAIPPTEFTKKNTFYLKRELTSL